MTSLNSVAYSEVPTLQNEVQEVKVASGTKKDLRVLASREVVPSYNASLVSPVNILPSPVSYQHSNIPFPAISPGQPTTSKKANPWTRLCENKKLLLKHTVSCVLSAALYALCLIPYLAHEMDITQARTFIAILSGIAGFSIGFTLMRIVRKFYIATVWATVIHKSKNKGITLRHLVNYSEDPGNLVSASKLFYRRWSSQATARESRRDYDRHIWSLYLLIFMLLYVFSQLMSFALGRAVIITPISNSQTDKYKEIAIAGDVSDADIEKAATLRPIFNDTETHITWTLTPSTSKPPAISFPWDGDDVYFAETTLSQLVPNGAGLGTATLGYTTKANASVTEPNQKSAKIWYPRWGIRIKCQKLGAENIIPVSSNNYSYLFVPTDVIFNLFDAFQKPVPEILQNYDPVLNGTVDPNDTIDESYREGKALGAKFWLNGVASSYYSKLVSNDTGNGWTTVEAVLVRLNDTYAPNGTFTAYDREYNSWNTTRIGFDAAVCVEIFEPYVLDTYNSSVLPYSTMIVGKTNNVRGDLRQGSLDGGMLDDEDVHMKLDSTRLYPVYQTLHENSVHMMVKDNGRDNDYIPNPTLISFSNGTGFQGYTSLDPNLFAKAKANADASNMLPYFAGSQKLLARCYQDQAKASIKVNPIALASFVGSVWFIGFLLCLYVPPLPKDVPRRKFHLYTWVAAFLGGELQVLDSEEGKNVVDMRNMSLEDIRREFGNVRIKYNFG